MATPYRAGNARVSDIKVETGDHVTEGDVLAVLDNLGQLQGTVSTVQATLTQVRQSINTSMQEALERGVITRAEFDATQARAIEVALDGLPQADIAVTEANLNAAKADLARAQQELSKAYILAPTDGTVAASASRSGDKQSTRTPRCQYRCPRGGRDHRAGRCLLGARRPLYKP